jgi:hypothetical protein
MNSHLVRLDATFNRIEGTMNSGFSRILQEVRQISCPLQGAGQLASCVIDID